MGGSHNAVRCRRNGATNDVFPDRLHGALFVLRSVIPTVISCVEKNDGRFLVDCHSLLDDHVDHGVHLSIR